MQPSTDVALLIASLLVAQEDVSAFIVGVQRHVHANAPLVR